MLDKHDIALLEGMFKAQFKEQLEEQLAKQDKRFDIKLENLKVDLRDEIHSCVSASETRMISRMDMIAINLRKGIVSDIVDFVDEAILPQIEQHNLDIARINTHLKLA